MYTKENVTGKRKQHAFLLIKSMYSVSCVYMVKGLCASDSEDEFVEETVISQGTPLFHMQQLKSYLCRNYFCDCSVFRTIEDFSTRQTKQCKIQITITSYFVLKKYLISCLYVLLYNDTVRTDFFYDQIFLR